MQRRPQARLRPPSLRFQQPQTHRNTPVTAQRVIESRHHDALGNINDSGSGMVSSGSDFYEWLRQSALVARSLHSGAALLLPLPPPPAPSGSKRGNYIGSSCTSSSSSNRGGSESSDARVAAALTDLAQRAMTPPSLVGDTGVEHPHRTKVAKTVSGKGASASLSSSSSSLPAESTEHSTPEAVVEAQSDVARGVLRFLQQTRPRHPSSQPQQSAVQEETELCLTVVACRGDGAREDALSLALLLCLASRRGDGYSMSSLAGGAPRRLADMLAARGTPSSALPWLLHEALAAAAGGRAARTPGPGGSLSAQWMQLAADAFCAATLPGLTHVPPGALAADSQAPTDADMHTWRCPALPDAAAGGPDTSAATAAAAAGASTLGEVRNAVSSSVPFEHLLPALEDYALPISAASSPARSDGETPSVAPEEYAAAASAAAALIPTQDNFWLSGVACAGHLRRRQAALLCQRTRDAQPRTEALAVPAASTFAPYWCAVVVSLLRGAWAALEQLQHAAASPGSQPPPHQQQQQRRGRSSGRGKRGSAPHPQQRRQPPELGVPPRLRKALEFEAIGAYVSARRAVSGLSKHGQLLLLLDLHLLVTGDDLLAPQRPDGPTHFASARRWRRRMLAGRTGAQPAAAALLWRECVLFDAFTLLTAGHVAESAADVSRVPRAALLAALARLQDTVAGHLALLEALPPPPPADGETQRRHPPPQQSGGADEAAWRRRLAQRLTPRTHASLLQRLREALRVSTKLSLRLGDTAGVARLYQRCPSVGGSWELGRALLAGGDTEAAVRVMAAALHATQAAGVPVTRPLRESLLEAVRRAASASAAAHCRRVAPVLDAQPAELAGAPGDAEKANTGSDGDVRLAGEGAPDAGAPQRGEAMLRAVSGEARRLLALLDELEGACAAGGGAAPLLCADAITAGVLDQVHALAQTAGTASASLDTGGADADGDASLLGPPAEYTSSAPSSPAAAAVGGCVVDPMYGPGCMLLYRSDASAATVSAADTDAAVTAVGTSSELQAALLLLVTASGFLSLLAERGAAAALSPVRTAAAEALAETFLRVRRRVMALPVTPDRFPAPLLALYNATEHVVFFTLVKLAFAFPFLSVAPAAARACARHGHTAGVVAVLRALEGSGLREDGLGDTGEMHFASAEWKERHRGVCGFTDAYIRDEVAGALPLACLEALEAAGTGVADTPTSLPADRYARLTPGLLRRCVRPAAGQRRAARALARPWQCWLCSVWSVPWAGACAACGAAATAVVRCGACGCFTHTPPAAHLPRLLNEGPLACEACAAPLLPAGALDAVAAGEEAFVASRLRAAGHTVIPLRPWACARCGGANAAGHWHRCAHCGGPAANEEAARAVAATRGEPCRGCGAPNEEGALRPVCAACGTVRAGLQPDAYRWLCHECGGWSLWLRHRCEHCSASRRDQCPRVLLSEGAAVSSRSPAEEAEGLQQARAAAEEYARRVLKVRPRDSAAPTAEVWVCLRGGCCTENSGTTCRGCGCARGEAEAAALPMILASHGASDRSPFAWRPPAETEGADATAAATGEMEEECGAAVSAGGVIVRWYGSSEEEALPCECGAPPPASPTVAAVCEGCGRCAALPGDCHEPFLALRLWVLLRRLHRQLSDAASATPQPLGDSTLRLLSAVAALTAQAAATCAAALPWAGVDLCADPPRCGLSPRTVLLQPPPPPSTQHAPSPSFQTAYKDPATPETHSAVCMVRDIVSAAAAAAAASGGHLAPADRAAALRAAVTIVEAVNATTDCDEIGFAALARLCLALRPWDAAHVRADTRWAYLREMKLSREWLLHSVCPECLGRLPAGGAEGGSGGKPAADTVHDQQTTSTEVQYPVCCCRSRLAAEAK